MEVKPNILNNIEKHTIPTELILYDVLDKIFNNLCLRDLYQAARVCKSWNSVARRIILKRNDVQCLVVPITSDDEDNDVDDDEDNENEDNNYSNYEDFFKCKLNKWDLTESLRSLPYILLLFCDSDGPQSCNRSITEEFYLHYVRYINYSIPKGVFSCEGVSHNDDAIVGLNNKGVGLTIPYTSKLKISMFCPHDTDLFKSNKTLNDLTDEGINTLFDNEGDHNCFIFFHSYIESASNEEKLYCKNFITQFLTKLDKRCKSKNYSLWGGQVNDIVTTVGGNHRDDLIWFFSLRLYGPAISTWSIVVKADASSKEVFDILFPFKKQIKHKSNTIALAIIPTNETEITKTKLAKTIVFRTLFKNIPLTCIYNKDTFFQIGINSLNHSHGAELKHEKTITYLIITTE